MSSATDSQQSSDIAHGNASSWRDPLYTEPYIDVDEWRDDPERHRYVHGGFKDTDLRFSMYFPPAERYEDRFFHPVMHIAGNENAARGRLAGMDGDSIGFAFDSGGYMVESNMGSLDMRGPGDITNFRGSAATAEYSRVLAQEMYGGGRPYGYVYGGSGGGFKSTACVENAKGVWDGAVPFIVGCPISIPNVFSVQAHALRILQGKFEGIVDALEPGGSGDMYAGLNEEERAALEEVTRFGFPPRAWFAHERLSVNYTGVFASLMPDLVQNDPGYFEDFWQLPGYVGSNPTESLTRARIHHEATVTRTITTAQARELGFPLAIAAGTRADNLAGIELSSLPEGRLQGSYLTMKSGAAKGRKIMVSGRVENTLLLGGHFSRDGVVEVGDEVEIDNSIYLAAQTFHRHQNPAPEFYVWEQFRGPDGTPLYPQRPLVPNTAEAEGGYAFQSGEFDCKMIIMESMMDEAAYPWQADWYHTKVKGVLGDKLDDQFRLWYVDNAMHVNPSNYMTPSEGGPTVQGASWVDSHIISYSGVLQQALRDVAAWAEQGIAPAPSTTYTVEDGQIVLAEEAAERKSIQPVVTLTANGAERADVRVGEAVTLEATAEAPPGAGSVVSIMWDFDGSGEYPESSQVEPAPKVRASTTHTFTTPGTHFVAVRVAVRRDVNATSPYAQPRNLARARVVVSE